MICVGILSPENRKSTFRRFRKCLEPIIMFCWLVRRMRYIHNLLGGTILNYYPPTTQRRAAETPLNAAKCGSS